MDLRAKVFDALEKVNFPRCKRQNVRWPSCAVVNRAMCLGYYFQGSHGVTRVTQQFHEVRRLLTELCNEENPDFGYTCIQVNKNVTTKMHADKRNCGPSKIICLGDYQGGRLWYHDEVGPDEAVVPEGVKRGKYKEGDVLKGSFIDVKEKWVHFDGNKLHSTEAFTGRVRYALIYFTSDSFYSAPDHIVYELRCLGFAKNSKNPHQEALNDVVEVNRKSCGDLDDFAVRGTDAISSDEEIDDIWPQQNDQPPNFCNSSEEEILTAQEVVKSDVARGSNCQRAAEENESEEMMQMIFAECERKCSAYEAKITALNDELARTKRSEEELKQEIAILRENARLREEEEPLAKRTRM